MHRQHQQETGVVLRRAWTLGSTFVSCDNAGSYGPQRVGRLKDHRDRPIQRGRPRGEDLISDVVESVFLAHVTLSDEVVEFAQHGGARHPNRLRDFLCSHRCSAKGANPHSPRDVRDLRERSNSAVEVLGDDQTIDTLLCLGDYQSLLTPWNVFEFSSLLCLAALLS